MKGKKKQIVKAGSILLAAIVLGTGAWVTDMQVKKQVPELTTFVDVDELVSIGEEEVPLASAPKVTIKTKKSTKVVKMKKKAKKTRVKKKTTKKTRTKKKTSGKKTTITKIETTTIVTEKYKKGSKKKTVQTTKKIKTTVTVIKLATSTKADKNTNVTAQNSAAASTQKDQEAGIIEISKSAPLVDARIKSAYETLGFTIEIDPGVSYTGYFTAREQKITLRRNDDTIYHELGHFLAFVAGNVDIKAEFMAIYQEEKDLMEGIRKAYATQNSSEYFAESFREYTQDPVTLKNKRPKTYQSIVNALNVVTDTQISRILAVYGTFWNNNK